MEAALKLVPVAGCAIALVYLLMALLAGHELMQAAHASVALAFAVVPYLAVRALRDLLPGQG